MTQGLNLLLPTMLSQVLGSKWQVPALRHLSVNLLGCVLRELIFLSSSQFSAQIGFGATVIFSQNVFSLLGVPELMFRV